MTDTWKKLVLSAVTIAGLAATTAVDVYYVHDVRRESRETLQHSAAIAAGRISGRIRDMIHGVEGLAAFMTSMPLLPNGDAFDRYVSQFTFTQSNARALQLVDADGVIVHEVPAEGNETALGLDLKPMSDWSFLEAARQLHRTVVGPGQLVQGPLGIIVRTPLYRDKLFLGWVQGVYDVENLADRAVGDQPQLLTMQLVGPEGRIILGSKQIPESAVSVPITSDGSTWQLRVALAAPERQVGWAPLALIWVGGLSLVAAVVSIVRDGWRKEGELRLMVQQGTADPTDTNDRPQTEAAGANYSQEAQYRHLVEQLPVIRYTARMDENGRTIFISRQIEAVLGDPPQVWIDNPHLWSSRLHPDDRERVQTAWNDACRTDEPFRVEYRMMARDGSEHWFFDEARVMRDAQGKPSVMQGVMFDITQRKRAEDALRVSEQRFRQIFAAAPVSIWHEDFTAVGDWLEELRQRGIRDLDAFLHQEPQALKHALSLVRLVDVNDTTLRMFDVDSKEELLSEWTKLFTEDTLEVFAEEVRAIWDGTGRVNAECTARTARGRSIHYRMHWVAPLEDGRLNLGRVIVALADITEQKQAEEALRENGRKLQKAQRIAHLGYWEFDFDRDVANWSEESDRILGLPRTVHVWNAAAVRQLVHPDDRVIFDEAFARAQHGERDFGVEFRVVRSDGKVRHIHIFVHVNSDEMGHRAFGAIQDVTEQKTQRELLQTILDNIPVMVAFIDAHGRTQWVNRHWVSVLGWSLEDATSRDILAEMYPDPEYRKSVVQFALQGGGSWADFSTNVKDGRTVETSWANVMLTDGRSIGIGIDITERKRAEEALRESADRLQHLSRRLVEVQEEERRNLARELHDEFGQLLATITVQLHMVKDVTGEAALSQLEECLSLLQQAGEQMRGLALELRPTMLESSGLEAALRWLAEQHQQRTGIATEFVGHANDVPEDVAIACFRIAQEALTNILRHSQAQHAWIELSPGEGALELAVRDDGIGFDVATTLEQAPGRVRLGLVGMRERAQTLAGTLELDSKPEHGTCVCAIFPLPETSAEPHEGGE